MPLLTTISQPGAYGGIWAITESWEQLCRLLPREEDHRAYALQHFRSEKRRREYAAVRALLYTLTGEDCDVTYHPSGRPRLADGRCRLSVSHTAGYAAVLLSHNGRPGIDIEVCSPRILSLKERIVGTDEQAESMYELLLHWSAKETAFKILDREGIDFTRHLTVSGLSCTAHTENPDTEGGFDLAYRPTDGIGCALRIHYLTTSHFVLTWAVDEQSFAV